MWLLCSASHSEPRQPVSTTTLTRRLPNSSLSHLRGLLSILLFLQPLGAILRIQFRQRNRIIPYRRVVQSARTYNFGIRRHVALTPKRAAAFGAEDEGDDAAGLCFCGVGFCFSGRGEEVFGDDEVGRVDGAAVFLALVAVA